MIELLGLAPSGLKSCLGMDTRLRLLGGYPRSVSKYRYIVRRDI